VIFIAGGFIYTSYKIQTSLLALQLGPYRKGGGQLASHNTS